MEAESAAWKRQESIPFPTVWHRCTGRKPMPDGRIPKFRIQDTPEEMFDEMVDLMCNKFTRDSLLFQSTKLADDPVSVEEFAVLWRKILKQGVSLVALQEEDGEEGVKHPRIAGFNFTFVTVTTDETITSSMFKGKAAQLALGFFYDFALKDVNIFEYYGVDAYMTALGLYVLPDFRGQGLAEHLLRARFPMGKALSLKATMTFFGPPAAQKAAEKAGMKVIKEAKFCDFVVDGKAVFPHMTSGCLKIMGATFD